MKPTPVSALKSFQSHIAKTKNTNAVKNFWPLNSIYTIVAKKNNQSKFPKINAIIQEKLRAANAPKNSKNMLIFSPKTGYKSPP